MHRAQPLGLRLHSRWRSGLTIAATVAGLALLAANLGLYGAAQFHRAQSVQGEQQSAPRAQGEQQIAAANDVRAVSVLSSFPPSATTALLGAVLGFFLEPLRTRVFGPKLRVRFNRGDGKHVAESSMVVQPAGRSPQEVQSRWVRVSMENVGWSHLVDGEAFLVAVEREHEGRWTATPFIDPLRLPWSSTERETAWGARDLPRGVQFFVDVCHSIQGAWGAADQLCLSTSTTPFRLRYLFSDHGRYRLTVTVTGKGIKPTTRNIVVAWTGVWDELEAADS
jgi:hypothetical protein